MKLLEVKNLKMYYETLRGYVRAVDDVSFSMERGDVLGLVGESACGKTSVALAILKLLPPNGRIIGGSAVFEGKDLVKLGDEELRKEIRWKKISIVFQGAMNALNPVKRIGDQIAEAIILHERAGKEESQEKAKKLLEMVGIDPSRARDYPHEFSGGMKQRAMIAMALACNPNLVIADEPTTGLDVIVQAHVMDVVKKLREKLQLSMILITHDLSLVAETCDKVVIMYAGKIAEIADVFTLFKEPLHPYTRRLIGALPDIRRVKTKLVHIPGSPPSLLEPPSGCRFHDRCPSATSICKREEPALREVEREHFVACSLV